MKQTNKQKGFTFVEVLVVLALFSILITVFFGIFSYSIKIQKYSLASQYLVSQTSYAMEYMARMIRMAKQYTDPVEDPAFCVNDLGDNYSPNISPTGNIKFIKAEVYNGIKTKKCVHFSSGSGTIFQYEPGNPAIDAAYLLPDDIEIVNLAIHISGDSNPPKDDIQPRVTIYMTVKMKNMNPAPTVRLQTTVSQRDLDLPI